MLPCVLLHVIPATGKVDVLTDFGARKESPGGVRDAAETKALDIGYGHFISIRRV